MTRLLALIVLVAAFSAQSVSAQWNDPRWAADRQYYMNLSARACEGDATARQTLENDAWDSGHPIAMNSWASVLNPNRGCVGVATGGGAMTLHFWELAANGGYPPAMYNWGFARLDGDFGLDVDIGEGLHWMENAVGVGYPLAAATLAEVYSRGLYGQRRDQQAAQAYFQRAQQLGLPQDRLAELADLIGASADAGGGSPVVQPDVQPQPQPGPGGGAGYFQVTIGGASSYGGVPRLGDRQNMGNWVDQIVYVGQLFGREGGCWTTGGLYIVGRTRVDMTEYATATLEQLIENSDRERQAGRGARYVQDFRDLNAGIAFIEQNQDRVDNTGQPFMMTLAEAQAYGPRCQGNSGDIDYPAPVRAAGF